MDARAAVPSCTRLGYRVPWMLPLLVLNPGRPDEQVFHLKPSVTTIGRTRENDIAVLHRSLSRKHARIELDGERIALVDLASKNGTFVNDGRIARCELQVGDLFQCGDLTFRVVAEEASNATVSATGAPVESPPHTRRDAGESLHRVRDKLSVLLEASRLLVGAASMEAALREIVELAYEIFDVDCVALVLVDESGGLRAVTVRGDAEGAGYDRRVVAHILRAGEGERITDAATDERLGQPAEGAQVRSAMGAPLIHGGRAAGVLYADHRETAGHFSEADMELLTALANHASAALAMALAS
jgi:adenylate cyclase